MRKNFFLVLCGFLVFVADQAVKIFLIRSLRPYQTIPVIKNIFHITLVFNRGCAFGLFRNQPAVIFSMISLAAVIFLLYFLRRLNEGQFFSRLAAVLLISGALSNLADRVRLGVVVDFLDFRIWPVFNLGDSAITIGILILVLNMSLKVKKDKCIR